MATKTKDLRERFTDYTAALAAADRAAGAMRNRRVRYQPFGHDPHDGIERTGRISRVLPTGLIINWDDKSVYWGQNVFHPDDFELL